MSKQVAEQLNEVKELVKIVRTDIQNFPPNVQAGYKLRAEKAAKKLVELRPKVQKDINSISVFTYVNETNEANVKVWSETLNKTGCIVLNLSKVISSFDNVYRLYAGNKQVNVGFGMISDCRDSLLKLMRSLSLPVILLAQDDRKLVRSVKNLDDWHAFVLDFLDMYAPVDFWSTLIQKELLDVVPTSAVQSGRLNVFVIGVGEKAAQRLSEKKVLGVKSFSITCDTLSPGVITPEEVVKSVEVVVESNRPKPEAAILSGNGKERKKKNREE